MRVAVLGHVEWVEFLRVERVPHAGEIIQGTPVVGVPAGGGGVAAVALARWGAEVPFFTALGDDDLGHRAKDDLARRGVIVHAAFRSEYQRRALTLVDAQRERTIILSGDRHVAHAADPLPWDALASCDGVYITGGDVEAVRRARAARVVVGTSRVLPLFRAAGIQLDALVGSENDVAEVYRDGDLEPRPRLVVRTDGARGGYYVFPDGTRQTWTPAPVVVRGDSYGAGDTFAAALTFALAEQRTPGDAVMFAATRAAEVLGFDGPYPPGDQ
ncbi:MAG: ribokinase [Kofleriaceae bacterium]|nr:ribokinase [Kofleriaceae bacterium]